MKHQTTSEGKTSEDKRNFSGTSPSHLALGQVREPLQNISPHISSSLCSSSLPLSVSSITVVASQSANPCKEGVSPTISLTNQVVSSARVGGALVGTFPPFLSLSHCLNMPLAAELAVSPMLPGSTHMLRHRRAGTFLGTEQAALF